jgi:hypothetical protein
MQNELNISHPGKVQIVTINYAGHESGVTAATTGRDTPLLQDTTADDVVGTWKPAFRDVVMTDKKNFAASVHNLTSNNLATPANYAALKAMLVLLTTK